MYLIQLTDLHIGLPGQDTRAVDVRANFLRALEKVRERQPEKLVLTGDLCYDDGDRSIYQWIRKQLDPLRIEYELIAGNHDNSEIMGAAFERVVLKETGELYFQKAYGDWQVFFLDTGPARMSDRQKIWLGTHLSQATGPILIFMHHPPCRAGLKYMDEKYPFQEIDEAKALFRRSSRPIEIFCGHYHIEKTIRFGHVAVHITPSLFFQMDMHQDGFAIDHYRPALREIWLEEDRLASTVTYLDPLPGAGQA